jgi:hypothetical protein
MTNDPGTSDMLADLAVVAVLVTKEVIARCPQRKRRHV